TYGAVKAPRAKTIAHSHPNVRWPLQWRSGTSAIRGARSASDHSIVVRAPSRAITEPLGMPRIAIGAISTARTMLVFVAEPVVTRTNQGSATKVIAVPPAETASATRSAIRVRERSIGGEI